MLKQKQTKLIKQLASEFGFNFCGIAQATKLDDDARRLELWLNKGMHGNMQYMERFFELRIDLVNGAGCKAFLLLNYFPNDKQDAGTQNFKICFGKDYHEVIREN
jgi:epoxyqueuosine reductase